MEEHVESIVRQMQGKDDILCEQVTQLLSISNKLYASAAQYDLNDKCQYNGIRTFVNIVKKFVHLLSHLCNVTPSTSVIHRINCLRRLSPLLLRTAMAVDMSTNRQYGLDNSDFAADGESIDRSILEIIFNLSSDELEALHVNGVRNFYLEEDIRKTLDTYYFPLIPFQLLSTFQAIKVVCNRQKLSKFIAKYSLSGTLYDIRCVWGAGDKKSSRMFMQWKTSKLKCGKINKVHLPRSSSTWLLGDSGQVTPCEARKGTIKCYLHLPSNYSKDKLILYMHGGGYIALTSKSFEAQLAYMSRKLSVPILSVDYGLMPENHFPAPLQDALDAYLALVQGTENAKIKQLMAGISATNIILAGDSAGAHMAIGLSYVLNEIRKQTEGPFTMPRAISAQFPAAQLSLGPMSPARCLLCIDSLLSPSILVTASAASNGLLVQDEAIFVSQSTRGIATGSVSYLGDILSNEQSKLHGYQMIEATLSMLKNPLWNLLVYNDIDALKDIPLYVHASEFDPLLDDSIALCRFWKGPVTFDVATGVMHGFPPFSGFSDACKKAYKMSIHHIQQAFDLANNTD